MPTILSERALAEASAFVGSNPENSADRRHISGLGVSRQLHAEWAKFLLPCAIAARISCRDAPLKAEQYVVGQVNTDAGCGNAEQSVSVLLRLRCSLYSVRDATRVDPMIALPYE